MRQATLKDLPALWDLEQESFEPYRQESMESLRRSILSPAQEVWVTTAGGRLTGSLFLRIHPRTLRIYSIAVSRDARGTGIGKELMQKAIRRARQLGKREIVLEVDAAAPGLIAWYRDLGFGKDQALPDYYAPGRHALRLRAVVAAAATR